MKAVALALAALLVTACGSDGDGGGANAPVADTDETKSGTDNHAMLIMEGAALPACDAAAEGRLVYVLASEEFQACTGGQWAIVVIKAKASTETAVTRSITCIATLEDAFLVGIRYAVVEMKNGDVFVTVNVGNPEIEASASRYYTATQEGAKEAFISVRNDLKGTDTAGYWEVLLNRESLAVTVRYKDAVDGDGQWSMTPDKCVVNQY